MSITYLNDRTVREFITHGYTLVQSDLPPEFHHAVCAKLDATLKAEGNLGNNVLPRIPEIGQVFTSPSVHGALHSLLGPGYSMHPHRYCHLNRPGSQGQDWHKDDFIFDHNVRHHRFRWVMAFYYPQDVDADMGPTGLTGRGQFHNHISNADSSQSTEEEIKLCGPAGTVAIVNFDVWHRATANISNRPRSMLKFQFLRMEEPLDPTWDISSDDGQPVTDDPYPALSAHIWRWLSGTSVNRLVTQPLNQSELLTALQSTSEPIRLNAAYALGNLGARAVPTLIDALRTEAIARAETNQIPNPTNVQGGNPSDLDAAHALTAAGPAAVPALLDELSNTDWPLRAAAADTLGNLGRESHMAIPALTRALADENPWVRRNAAEALGTIGPQKGDSIADLAAVLADESEPVRRNAALALAKIGPLAATAVPSLRTALYDENRYVRFNAQLALQRIASPDALDALWNDINIARWCPITTKDTPY